MATRNKRTIHLALTLDLLTVLTLGTQAFADPVVLPAIANADFETDANGFTNYPGYTGGSNPAEITGWPGTGNRGINPGNGAGAPFRDNGNNTSNVAFLQGAGQERLETADLGPMREAARRKYVGRFSAEPNYRELMSIYEATIAAFEKARFPEHPGAKREARKAN